MVNTDILYNLLNINYLSFQDVPLCDIYKIVREKVENERPELVNKMTNNLGSVFFCSKKNSYLFSALCISHSLA